MNTVNPIYFNALQSKNFNKSTHPFLRKQKEYFENKRVQKAVNLGKILYNNPKTPAIKVLKKFTDNVEIEYVNPNEEIDAELNYTHDKNFKAQNFKIYTSHSENKKSKGRKMQYALALAHEYTHYLQFSSKNYTEFMKKLCNNDYYYLCKITLIGFGIFDEFDDMKFSFTDKVFNFIDKITEKIYSTPLPRKKSFTKKDILKSKNLKSQEEFNKYILDKFDNIFSRTIEIILTEPEASDDNIRSFIQEISKDEEKLNKFKQDIKAFCALKAQQEKEAYSVESKLARNFLNTDRRLNIDSYTIYYSMLENAFK